MTSICVSGSKDAVNVFFDEILNLSNNGVFIETNGKNIQILMVLLKSVLKLIFHLCEVVLKTQKVHSLFH